MSGDDKSWTSTFDDADQFASQKSRSATPQERLEWLEQAQDFAVKNGQLRSPESVTRSGEIPLDQDSSD